MSSGEAPAEVVVEPLVTVRERGAIRAAALLREELETIAAGLPPYQRIRTYRVTREALPRTQADAANFSKVELILSARDLMPFAIRIYKPGGQDQDVYQFNQNTSLIDKGLDLIRDFSKPVTPLGYTFILEDAARGECLCVSTTTNSSRQSRRIWSS